MRKLNERYGKTAYNKASREIHELINIIYARLCKVDLPNHVAGVFSPSSPTRCNRKMNYHFATIHDLPTLARMNRQLVEDEKHRNRFKSDAWMEDRIRGFLTGGYEAILFERDGKVVAYALYIQHPDYHDTIYLYWTS